MESGASAQMVSPSMLSASRLLAMTFTCGQLRKSSRDDLRTIGNQVLAIIQHEQQVARAQRLDSAWSAARDQGTSRMPDGIDQRLRNQGRIGDRSITRPTRRRAEIGQAGRRRCLERQPRLARAAGAGQREQPRRGEKAFDLRHFALAPDEAGDLRGQIVWQNFERAQRRGKLSGRSCTTSWKMRSGWRKSLEPALAEIAQHDFRWQRSRARYPPRHA